MTDGSPARSDPGAGAQRLMLDSMRVLLFSGMASLGYIEQVEQTLRAQGAEVDVIRFRELTHRRSGSDRWSFFGSWRRLLRIPKLGGLVRVVCTRSHLRRFAHAYDTCHVFYNEPLYGLFLARPLRRCATALLVFVAGSDFLRTSSVQRAVQERMYRRARYITFNNVGVRDRFNAHYRGRYSNKLRIIYFGMAGFARIADVRNRFSREQSLERLGVGPASLTIVCGHNGAPAQRHAQIVSECTKVRDRLPDDTLLLVPMTYGCDDSYRDDIEKRLTESGFRYRLFRSRMSEEDVAHLRSVADVLIHVQTTDSFSASMQEHFFAGTLVINGAWLPYGFLRDLGVSFLEVESIDELAGCIPEVVRGLDGYRDRLLRNRSIMESKFGWGATTEAWIRTYRAATDPTTPRSAEA